MAIDRKKIDKKVEEYGLIFAVGTALAALWKAIIAMIDGINDED